MLFRSADLRETRGVDLFGAEEAVGLAGARIGGPFTLTNQDGKQVRWDDFKGQYRLVYFGYTYCPDICPATLAELRQLRGQLPEPTREALRMVLRRDAVEGWLREEGRSALPDRQGDALTSGTLAQFAATTSAQLAGVISDETGSGALVFGTRS